MADSVKLESGGADVIEDNGGEAVEESEMVGELEGISVLEMEETRENNDGE